MTKIYTTEQQDFIREARTEYCEFARKIDDAKAEHKAIFYKESQDEVESVVNSAVEIARL